VGEGTRTLASKINLFPRVEGPLSITRAALAASTHALSSKDKDQDKKESEGQSKSLIEYDDFAKLEIKVAVVLNAESHPNADRLLKLTLDAGESQPRTVCAGIAAAYKPEVLIGRRVALLANLKPRTLRGVISQGMILAAGAGEGLCLIDVPAELPAGEIIS
jgi:methionyl-tRNA synthetase